MDLFAAALARCREICLGLPQTVEEAAWVGIRWKVRNNTFAHVLEIVDGYPPSFAQAVHSAGPATVVAFRASDAELGALLGDGRFFGPLWGRTDLALVVDAATDWAEVGELLTESYRLRAPRFLVRQLDGVR
jgi:YjbR